jgi:hypothetical protein
VNLSCKIISRSIDKKRRENMVGKAADLHFGPNPRRHTSTLIVAPGLE